MEAEEAFAGTCLPFEGSRKFSTVVQRAVARSVPPNRAAHGSSSWQNGRLPALRSLHARHHLR